MNRDERVYDGQFHPSHIFIRTKIITQLLEIGNKGSNVQKSEYTATVQYQTAKAAETNR